MVGAEPVTNFEFTPWPRTHRLFRDVVVTEKIDGTNAAVHISQRYEVASPSDFELRPGEVIIDGRLWCVGAQSRKRVITPSSDNYSFARWVQDNAADLVPILGAGLHFGEWWGQGIQRRYGLEERRFSLFNTARWWDITESGQSMAERAEQSDLCGQVDAVPVLYEGPFSEARITSALRDLQTDGSYAAPGFMNPEGVCVFHTQTRSVFKVTLDHNDASKWEAA